MIPKPDYHSQEDFKVRTRKLAELRALGIDPYPAHFKPTLSVTQLNQKYHEDPLCHSEEAAAGNTPAQTVTGRLVLLRAMGKNAFGHIQDGPERIQVMFNRDLTTVTGYTSTGELTPLKLIEKMIDLGDIIGIEGHLFRTQKGELTLFAKQVTLLTKTLLPLPDKHAGLADKGQRYRKRWLDLIANPDVQKTFQLRSSILKFVRDYFHEQGFIEVETPVLQTVYGGAEARPFTTHLNALDQEMFLRISLEPSLKKLIVGGMDRVFEIGRVFRNEGIDRNHNPEFTLLEAYAANWDYHDMMRLVENLYEQLAVRIFGTTTVPVTVTEAGEMVEIDMKAPWKRLTMKESLLHYAKIDVDALTDTQMRQKLQESGHIDPRKLTFLNCRGLLIAALFEVFVESHLTQPHHIIDHPIETTPLCKPHRDPAYRSHGLVERFESFILSGEMCNAYSELNDPELQRALFEKQVLRRESGDEEASPLDEEFLEAVSQGLPPTGGVGIGIDRLVMLFTKVHSIRDILFFPLMKPEGI